MDEVYSFIPGVKEISPQLEDMPHSTNEFGSETKKMFASFHKLRDLALKALEDKRAAGIIGASSEASLDLSFDDASLVHALASEDPEELPRLFGVGKVTVVVGKPAANVTKATGQVCDRCRSIKDDVVAVEGGAHLCERCQKALGK